MVFFCLIYQKRKESYYNAYNDSHGLIASQKASYCHYNCASDKESSASYE